MNGASLKLLLIGLMFGAAVMVAVVALFPEDKGGGADPGATAPPGREPVTSSYERDPEVPIRVGVAAVPPVPDELVELPGMVELAAALNAPEGSVEEDLEVVEELIRQYVKRVEAAPSGGLNEEIVTSLRGKNPRRFVFIPSSHPKLNEKGELLDRFGTPYYLHPVSRDLIEVRSAGPDRTLWTKDDVWLGGESSLER